MFDVLFENTSNFVATHPLYRQDYLRKRVINETIFDGLETFLKLSTHVIEVSTTSLPKPIYFVVSLPTHQLTKPALNVNYFVILTEVILE